MHPTTLVSITAASTLLAVALAAANTSSPAPVGPPPPAKEGESCGTIRGIACAEGLWCDLRPGACRAVDLDGICVRIPQVCTQEYAPVCGCDGKNYGNDCNRRAARAQKDHDGECARTGDGGGR